MTPPDSHPPSQDAGNRAESADLSCPARGKSLPVLKKRSDFLAAAKARRVPTAGFLLQARQRRDTEDAAGVRVGYTCSKKVGNAVIRNRAKRRLRAIAHEVLKPLGHVGWDYVLVGKPGVTISRDFPALRADLEYALRKVHS